MPLLWRARMRRHVAVDAATSIVVTQGTPGVCGGLCMNMSFTYL